MIATDGTEFVENRDLGLFASSPITGSNGMAYYTVFDAQCVVEDRILPDHVRQEFEDYLKCGLWIMASCG